LQLKSLIDKEWEKSTKEVFERFSEINLHKKHLENNMELALLPKIFKEEMGTIEKEIIKRREFEIFFQKIINFVNGKILSKEEQRRKEYL
jgi:hypothetical protein